MITIGDRIQTPTGRLGIIEKPPYRMPLYHLIRFENGQLYWMLKTIIHPAAKVERKSRRSALAA